MSPPSATLHLRKYMNRPIFQSKIDKALEQSESLGEGEETSFSYKDQTWILTKTTLDGEEIILIEMEGDYESEWL